jgi:thiol-disulfide isomerase/thioredoxin
MKLNVVLVGMLALLAVLAGCTQAVQKDAMAGKGESAAEKEIMEGEWTPEEVAAMEKEHAETMPASGYSEFDMKLLERANAEKKVVVLDFAANWCPACQAEGPELRKGVELLNNPNVLVMKVHYKDDQVTDEQAALAEKFQVPYQHTKVVIKDGTVLLKSPEAWTAERFVDELSRLV